MTFEPGFGPDFGGARCRCVLSFVETTTVGDELDAQTQEAWSAYLKATRSQIGFRYADVEPWAWARLQQRLRAIRARRRKVMTA